LAVQRLEQVSHVMAVSWFVVSVPAMRFWSPHHTSLYPTLATGAAVCTVGASVGGAVGVGVGGEEGASDGCLVGEYVGVSVASTGTCVGSAQHDHGYAC
jgi:hypothetical protein